MPFCSFHGQKAPGPLRCIDSYRGIAQVQQSVAQLRTAFGSKAPCQTTISNWFAEFKGSRVNLSDDFRGVRPSTAVNNKKIDAVCHMIETPVCLHVVYHQIRAADRDPVVHFPFYHPSSASINTLLSPSNIVFLLQENANALVTPAEL
ncbi:hypothetical protein EVAR_62461_1 [Eumeta japonica]|uniref:Mos1 transposase HTH domain-containing protein n=1 Tax=Eumeta variegata TaxID=151549 RepID=A0A4C1ZQC4_EUMVA|nr:hypothetical protein EVAR_62461_1 [Eumeta japonica]